MKGGLRDRALELATQRASVLETNMSVSWSDVCRLLCLGKLERCLSSSMSGQAGAMFVFLYVSVSSSDVRRLILVNLVSCCQVVSFKSSLSSGTL